jgi:hypothetical protein
VFIVSNAPQGIGSMQHTVLVIADDAFFYYVSVFWHIGALARSDINYVFFTRHKIVFMQICGKFYMKELGHTSILVYYISWDTSDP